MVEAIRVILADDHKMLREGFRTMIKKQSCLAIIAEAENGQQLVELTQQLKPDVVITDIQMPVLTGIQACRIIKQKYPEIGVLALSSYDTDNYVMEMLNAGANGYLLKNTSKAEVVKAVQTVYKGGSFYCDDISYSLQKMLVNSRHTPYKPNVKTGFSEKELEIIRLASQELTSKEIADRVNLSARTVESHKERMQQRIEAKNMIGVIMYAVRNNLIELNNK